MKYTNKYLPLILIAGSLFTGKAYGRQHYYYTPFDALDDMWSSMLSKIDNKIQWATDNETVQLQKFETVKLPKVTSQITQDENNITIKVTCAAPEKAKSDKMEIKAEDYVLHKNKIEITPEDNMIEVFIPLNTSFVKILIDKNHYNITKGVSAKKEEKDKNSSISSSSLFERSVKFENFPSAVDLSNAKNIKASVDPKSNSLNITLPKKKKTKITVE